MLDSLVEQWCPLFYSIANLASQPFGTLSPIFTDNITESVPKTIRLQFLHAI